MKFVLLTAAALGLSISAASAECAGHAKTTAVDKETTASVIKQTTAPAQDQTVKAEDEKSE